MDASLAPDAGPENAALPEPGPLVNNALWQVVGQADDPFSAGPSAPCPPLSSTDESLGGELVYAIRTERCPALTVRQSSRRDVLAGDSVSLRFYHSALTAPEPATALILVQLGEREIFRRELAIPSEAAEISDIWQADESFPKGTPVLFHVQNHGENEYALVAIEVRR